MARKNDLAGLAALGALGMLLSQKRDSSSSASANPMDVMTSGEYGGPNAGGDIMTDREPNWESGVGTTLRPSSGGRTPTAAPSATPRGGPRRGPAFEAGSGGGRGPAFGEEAAYRQQQYEQAQRQAATPEGRAERQRMEQSQALEAVRPEEYLIGSPLSGLKGVAALARGLAGRQAARGVEKAAEYSQPVIGYADRAKLAYSGGEKAAKGATKQLPGPTRQIGYEGSKALEKAEREAVTNPLEWASGRNSSLMDKRGLSEGDWTGGAVGYKKGGKTKKSATKAAVKMSASRRGDGIAQRGKTRGIMR